MSGQEDKDMEEIIEYADEEDRLMSGKKGGKKAPSANRSNRVHMDSQQNNKEKQEAANRKASKEEK